MTEFLVDPYYIPCLIVRLLATCANYFVSYAIYIYILVIQTLFEFLLAVINQYEFGSPGIRK
jgi:hypothetical protein